MDESELKRLILQGANADKIQEAIETVARNNIKRLPVVNSIDNEGNFEVEGRRFHVFFGHMMFDDSKREPRGICPKCSRDYLSLYICLNGFEWSCSWCGFKELAYKAESE